MVNGPDMNASRDLTQGSVVKKLLFFAGPLVVSTLITQLYNVVDAIIAGQFIGKNALAAVGSSFPIMFFFNALFMGVSMGTGIIVSQYYGAKNQHGLQKVVSTTFMLSLILIVIITFLGLLLSKPLLQFLGTPSDIIEDSSAYLMIVFAGTLGSMLYSMGGGILRGMGDSKWPLYFLIISSILNAVLAAIFVIALGWGVAGTATATVISQTVSAILIIIRLNRGGYGVSFNFKNLKIDKDSAKTIIRLGLPNGIQMMTMSIGIMIIQRFSNGFGSDFIAANNAIMRVDGFATLPMYAIGTAVTTFAGQNIGAGLLDRAKHGIKSAAIIVIGIGVMMGILLTFLGVYMIQAFTSDPNVIEIGGRGIRVIAFTYCLVGLDQCFGGAMRGAGAAIAPMVTGLTAQFLRIPFVYILAVMPNDYMGLFYSTAITMIVSCTMIIIYYRKGAWRNKAVVSPQIAAVSDVD